MYLKAAQAGTKEESGIISVTYYQSPVGEILLGSYEEKLCLADWKERVSREVIDTRIQKAFKAQYIEQGSLVVDKTIEQLDAYFSGNRRDFGLPLLMVGTPFQKSVWHTLTQIPYGDTVSYMDIAKSIGKPKAIRAVATAIGTNALSIVIPCHRVVGSDGDLRGYAGGLEVKKRLLTLESKIVGYDRKK
jgi:methylated-DNA-[protein]-cysteine S-methyltransferase